MRAIIPYDLKFLPARMIVAIEEALDEAAEVAKDALESPTKTWKKSPTFTIKRMIGKREITTDSKIYLYVSRGTRVRYAVMSPNFQAKTSFRVMSSGPGAGGMVRIGKKPLPGIKAREFEEVSAEIAQREIANTVNRALENAINK